jgi:hypothetical protein
MVTLMYDRRNVCDSNHFPMQISTGVTIDIFPLFGLPDDGELQEYARCLKEAEQDMLNKLYLPEECSVAAGHLFDLFERYDMDKVNRVGNVLTPYLFKDVFSKEWFGEGVMAKFEGEDFCIPADADAYLRALYGDYMTPPPENQRQGHHFFRVFHKK